MKNRNNFKSQAKNQKVMHRGANLAPPPGANFAPRIYKKFFKKMRAICARIRVRGSRIVRESGRLPQTTLILFSGWSGLKDGNGLLATSRTLKA